MNDTTRFSQNFLRDPKLVTSLLSKTNITPGDTVYDIGGKGIIAAALAERCRTVISVEIDAQLASKLRENLREHANAMVYQADFLTMPLPQTSYKVFANIPFNLSADILHKLTDAAYSPSTSYLIVQKEFADKLTPWTGGYNSQLSVLLGVRFEVQIIQHLRPTDFYPRPKVQAALLEITSRSKPLLAPEDEALFRDFVAYNYSVCQPSVKAGLSRVFTSAKFCSLAETLAFPASATPAQLGLHHWLRLFACASQKPALLKQLVGGYEQVIEQRHSKRTKWHRTR